jgi:hypothetical protein
MMNWLDAQLTLLWLHLNIATEGNGVMSHLISHGEGWFISVKLVVGAFAAYVLYRSAHLPLARHGMTLALCVYGALMIVHAAAGCSALGWQAPAILLSYLGNLPQAVLAMLP